MGGLAADYTDANQTGLADYFVKKFNLIGTDAEYQKGHFTLSQITRDTERLKTNDGFYEALKVAGARAGGPGWGKGNAYFFTSKTARWLVQRPYAQYARMTFDNLTLARTPTGTLIDLQGAESDDVKTGMLNTLEFELWNDGTGNRGQISVLGGVLATRVLTLANPSDVYNFEHNQVLTARTGALGDGVAHTDLYKVTDLNPNTGQITCVQLTSGSAWVAADYLYAYGSDAAYMPGIPTFIPAADPADTLLGVVRTGDPALSGWRFTFRASISYTIQYAFTQMGRWMDQTKKKFVCCLSSFDWLLLSQEREGRVMEDPGAMQKWGLEGLVVRTPFGPITCVAIPQLADGRGYIIDWTSWTLYTLGNLPHVAMEDGNVFTRLGINEPTPNVHPVIDGDGIAMQLRIWKILLCKRPMSNATFLTK